MVTPDIGLEATLRLIRNYYWWLQPFPQENRSSKNIGGSLGAYYFFKKQQGYVQARATYEILRRRRQQLDQLHLQSFI